MRFGASIISTICCCALHCAVMYSVKDRSSCAVCEMCKITTHGLAQCY